MYLMIYRQSKHRMPIATDVPYKEMKPQKLINIRKLFKIYFSTSAYQNGKTQFLISIR